MNPTDWIRNNAWSLIIAVVTMISTFTLYGFKIDALQKQSDDDHTAIVTLSQQQNTINVQLAQISTTLTGQAADIQYIKANIDRLFGRTGN